MYDTVPYTQQLLCTNIIIHINIVGTPVAAEGRGVIYLSFFFFRNFRSVVQTSEVFFYN